MTLSRKQPLGRTEMKKSRVKKDWQEVNKKLEWEFGCCRYCGTNQDVQRAHTASSRKQDVVHRKSDGTVAYIEVLADAIVPLCGGFANDCHGKYDRYELDLLPSLTMKEQHNLMDAEGGIEQARRRACGKRGRV